MKLLDRYIVKDFIFTLIFSLLALYVIFIVVTLMENLDEFLDNSVKAEIIIEYYLSYFPEIIKLLTPVSLLLASLFSVGKLSQQNEVTAMKSGGMSLYRLMMPLLIFSIFLSIGQFYFNGNIVPKSNERKKEIEREYLKKNRVSNSIYDLYFRDSPTKNLSMQFYSSSGMFGRRVMLNEFESKESSNITATTEASNIVWNDSATVWVLKNGITRKYRDGKVIDVERFDSTIVKLNINHEQLIKLKKDYDEMTFVELKEYIELLQLGGKDVSLQLINYHSELAFPFANIIIILFGVPFASIKRKGGMAVQIAAALVVSFMYLIFTQVGKQIGFAIGLDPIITGWLANGVFLFFSLIVIFKTRT